MKKIYVFLLTVSLFLSGTAILAQAGISQADKQQITDNLDNLVQAVNTGNVQKIASLISPDNTALQSEVQDRIRGGIAYQFDYSPFDKNARVLGESKIKVTGKFAASGVGWNISGLSTYFVFEKSPNQQWLITETDFHQKLGSDYTLNFIKKIFIIIGPIFLVSFVFWLWMLIDCAKREFDDKALWIILLIFLNFIAAILYFFIVKRKNVTRKPLEFKM
jgi:hypothetical protein